jgi:hypothetical protein
MGLIGHLSIMQQLSNDLIWFMFEARCYGVHNIERGTTDDHNNTLSSC